MAAACLEIARQTTDLTARTNFSPDGAEMPRNGRGDLRLNALIDDFSQQPLENSVPDHRAAPHPAEKLRCFKLGRYEQAETAILMRQSQPLSSPQL